MQSLARQVSEIVARCAASEEGRAVLATYDHVIQFTVLDGGAFYLEVKGGQARIVEGPAPDLPITEMHEIKAHAEAFAEWFSGRLRMIDAIETGRMFPSASHTTKRHLDHWLTRIIRIGSGMRSLKEVY